MTTKKSNEQDALIKVRGLKTTFGKTEVLKGIDTDIHQGDVVVVIGPSGSGNQHFLEH